jgi:hypothetical protein
MRFPSLFSVPAIALSACSTSRAYLRADVIAEDVSYCEIDPKTLQVTASHA